MKISKSYFLQKVHLSIVMGYPLCQTNLYFHLSAVQIFIAGQEKLLVTSSFSFSKRLMKVIVTGFIPFSSLNNDYVGKQLMAWKEYCAKYWKA